MIGWYVACRLAMTRVSCRFASSATFTLASPSPVGHRVDPRLGGRANAFLRAHARRASFRRSELGSPNLVLTGNNDLTATTEQGIDGIGILRRCHSKVHHR